MPDASNDGVYLFVDEAGDPDVFQRRGKVIAGTEGCSRFFILGKLEVEEPAELSRKLVALREKLVANPYFHGVPSFDPARRKTAVAFHAKDDLAEVRLQVLDLLAAEGARLRFHAVVIDKIALAEEIQRRNSAEPGYRYGANDLYDRLMHELFRKFHRIADENHVTVSRRGASDRNAAIRGALAHAEKEFQSQYGFGRGPWNLQVATPKEVVALQAVDYFLWALQRLYEPRVDARSGDSLRSERFFGVLRAQVAEVHDLSFGPPQGTFFTRQRELTVAARFGPPEKEKP
jgi:hypothetical protein